MRKLIIYIIPIIMLLKLMTFPLYAQDALNDTLKCPHCGATILLKNGKVDDFLVDQKMEEESSIQYQPSNIDASNKRDKTPNDFVAENQELVEDRIKEVVNEPEIANKIPTENIKYLTKQVLFSYPFFILLGVMLIFIGYFLIYQPRKRRKPLIKALKIIEENIESDFQEADDLLTKALTVGLKDREITEARFAQAYIRARLQKYSEASTIMEELKKTSKLDKNFIYLDLWLQSKQEKHVEVEEIYNKHHKILGNFLDTKLITSIAFIELGKDHWSRNEFELAVQFFDKVKQLEILKDRLPKNIDNHQIILGIISLFDGNIDEARRYFKGAIISSEKDKRQNLGGDLGLLLCEWKVQEFPNIDNQLSEIVKKLEKYSKKDVDDGKEEGQEKDILLRNVLLWHSVSLIFTWFQLPEKSGLPQSQKDLLTERLNKVKEIDPDMSDLHLIQGLIDYFFSYDTKREEAVKLLEEAIRKGVNVPEVINLVDREINLLEQQRKTLELFLNLLNKYLNDKSIPFNLRKELKNSLCNFSRFKEMEKGFNIGSEEDETIPSIIDLQNRGILLQKRVDNIVKPKLTKMNKEEVTNINKLLNGLKRKTEGMAKVSKKLEETEHKLMLRTGEFLFQEEEEIEIQD